MRAVCYILLFPVHVISLVIILMCSVSLQPSSKQTYAILLIIIINLRLAFLPTWDPKWLVTLFLPPAPFQHNNPLR